MNRTHFTSSILSLILLALLLPVGCGEPMMPTPTIYTYPDASPFAAVPTDRQSSTIDILYATDRKPGEPDLWGNKEHYTADRSMSLAFGSCKVQVGDGLTWEELVKQSTTEHRTKNCDLKIAEVKELVRFQPTPLLDKPGSLTDNDASVALQTEVKKRLAGSPVKEVYVFIHGFNNTFEEANFAMAEMWHFMGRPGVAVAYTWPAGRSYGYDRESGQFTQYHLRQFLIALVKCEEVKKINIIAHSRGTDVLTSILRDMLLYSLGANSHGTPVEPSAHWKLGQIVLCSPDLDLEVATQRLMADRISRLADRTTLYTSPTDRAIGAAGLIFKGKARLGQLDVEQLNANQKKLLAEAKKTNIVNCKVPVDFLGHSYYRHSPYVSSDLMRVMAGAPIAPPLRPLTEVIPGYWHLTPKAYPAKK